MITKPSQVSRMLKSTKTPPDIFLARALVRYEETHSLRKTAALISKACGIKFSYRSLSRYLKANSIPLRPVGRPKKSVL